MPALNLQIDHNTGFKRKIPPVKTKEHCDPIMNIHKKVSSLPVRVYLFDDVLI